MEIITARIVVTISIILDHYNFSKVSIKRIHV